MRANSAPTDSIKFFLPMGSIASNTSSSVGIFDASETDMYPETMFEVPSVATPRVKTTGNVVVSALSPLCYPDQSNPCFPNPCLNGVCSPPNSTAGDPLDDWLHGVTRYPNATFQCHCSPGYYGQTCQFKSNERPCFPGVHTDRYYRFNGVGSFTGIAGSSLNGHDFAISFWAQVNSTAAGQKAVSDGANLEISFGSNQIRFLVQGGNVYFPLGCDMMSEWHHYTGTMTGSIAKLYVVTVKCFLVCHVGLGRQTSGFPEYRHWVNDQNLF